VVYPGAEGELVLKNRKEREREREREAAIISNRRTLVIGLVFV